MLETKPCFDEMQKLLDDFKRNDNNASLVFAAKYATVGSESLYIQLISLNDWTPATLMQYIYEDASHKVMITTMQ